VAATCAVANLVGCSTSGAPPEFNPDHQPSDCAGERYALGMWFGAPIEEVDATSGDSVPCTLQPVPRWVSVSADGQTVTSDLGSCSLGFPGVDSNNSGQCYFTCPGDVRIDVTNSPGLNDCTAFSGNCGVFGKCIPSP
jgi:hypothetical protein